MQKKPTAIHKLDGTFRPDRHNGNEPQIESSGELKKPPQRLSKEARAIWREEAPPLIDAGIFTVADVGMFTDLCELQALYRQTMEKINCEFVTEGLSGQQVKNPLWSVARDLIDRVNSMRRDFGLSPVSRSKVMVAPKPKEESVWAKFDTPIRQAK